MVLICKPEQSGKTFIMIEQIIKDVEEPTEGKTTINFIFCDNNLLQTKQTSARVQSELTSHEEEVSGEVEGEIICNDERSYTEKNFYVEFSTGKGAKRDIPAIWFAITGPEPVQNIVCCTNGKRVSDIETIIRQFNSTPNFQDKYIFNIWLDEADKFTNFIGKTFRPLVHQNDNVQLYFLTATPGELFKKYGDLNTFPLEFTTSPNYHGWNDNYKTILENESGTTEGFIHHVLTNVVSARRGSKWYIPAGTKKVTHELVRDILLGKGFAVFVVNGDGLALSVPGEGRICEKKTEELNIQMLRMYREKNVAHFPVAVTGNICVGRGISIMSPEFIFDYGILSNCAKKAEASQNAGRLKSNMKDWPNYKPPTVFTTAKFDKVATEWEKKSRHLAEIAFENQEAGVSTVISKTAFKTVGEDFKYIKHPESFTTIKDVRDFLATVKERMGLKSNPRPEDYSKHKEQCGGYLVTSKLLTKGRKAKDLTADDRLTREKVNSISEGYGLSNTKGGKWIVLPFYENMDTPADQVQYQVRYVNRRMD